MLTPDNVFSALGDFITGLIGDGFIVVQAQQNRVPMPSAGNFAVMTDTGQNEIATPILSYAGESVTISQSMRISVQIDFYGANAGEYVQAFNSAIRSEFATSRFPNGIKPLHCSNAIQSPLVAGEKQFIQRWTITAELQYNPSHFYAQESALALAANLKLPVDLE